MTDQSPSSGSTTPQHIDADDDGIVGGAAGHALSNPPHQQFVIIGGRVEPFAAAMRKDGSALQQEQAAFRGCREQSPSSRFLDEVFVILVRFKPEERKAKTILTA